jgi:hypothetical protein
MDGFHHALEHRVEELARLLGIAVGEELHRALEIGEQHGDLLPLALQGTLGAEDLLDEVLGGVAFRRAESRARHCRLGLGSAEPLPAPFAELGALLVCSSATRAASLEPSPTLLAEYGVAGVFLLAPGTRHGAPPARLLVLLPSGRMGSVKLNVDPRPTWLWTPIRPPCSSTNFLARVRPSPVPSCVRASSRPT